MDGYASKRGHEWLLWAFPLAAVCGCAVTQPQQTPVVETEQVEPLTGRAFSLYVPAAYTPQKRWPLLVTLHGTFLFDDHRRQVRAWKALAERYGFLVAAPALRSTQGVLPRVGALWYEDLASDERAILAILRHLRTHYSIDARDIVLTGFSSGGFPMYWTGLRHPELFAMLIARQANCDPEMLRRIPLNAETRDLPVAIIYGSADLGLLRAQAFDAHLFLLRHGVPASLLEVDGGHRRHPEVACALWTKHCRPSEAAGAGGPPDPDEPVAVRRGPAPPRRGAIPPPPPPGGAPPAGPDAPGPTSAPAPRTASWHVVRRGDTYWSLAEHYLGAGRRWREIARANPDCRGQSLPVGRRIVIPPAGGR